MLAGRTATLNEDDRIQPTFERLVGYPPSSHAERSKDHDYAAVDRILPHPTYAPQSWISILNPGKRAADGAVLARDPFEHVRRPVR
jgi:Family of unknown function (DUF6194)